MDKLAAKRFKNIPRCIKSFLRFVCDRFLTDKIFLKINYRIKTGQKLNLDYPVLFNEKLQWLKLYDRKPLYTKMADKYEVYKFVEEKIGKKYLIPLLGVWDRQEDIDFDMLPNQFVLKCTHDSGGIIICKDKKNNDFISKDNKKLDMDNVIKIISASLKRNYFYKSREWVYKDIKPRIIAQQFISDKGNNGLLEDYKVFTFNGKSKLIQVHFNKSTNHKANFYSTNWLFQDFYVKEISDQNYRIQKPECLVEMLKLAETLAEGTPHLRVDFFYCNGKLYFGELTFYNWSGYGKFIPESYNELLGSWITLPKPV